MSIVLLRKSFLVGLILAFAGVVPPWSAEARAQSAAPAAAAADTGSTASQRLRPGDVVRLAVWRAEDLSGKYEVDETGTVVFPLLGPWRVTDDSPETLKRRLIEAYQVYLRHPSIDVTLLRRVNVRGAVQRPGLYDIDPTMTIADAVALAGGATPVGDPDEVRLLRGDEELTGDLSRRTRIGELPIRSGDQLFVPERSWISRNSNILASALSASVSLVIAIISIQSR